VTFSNPTALRIQETEEQPSGVAPADNTFSLGETVVDLPAQTVAPGQGELVLAIELPEGYKLNDQAPFTAITASADGVTVPAESQDFRQVHPELPVRLPVTFNSGSSLLSTDLTIYWCEAVRQTLCFVDRVTLRTPVTVDSSMAGHEVVMSYALTPPGVDSGFK
jgi:hypothetical protein